MNTKTLPFTYTHIFWGLIVSIVLSMSLYIYFVNSAIFSAAERQNVEERIVEIKSSISALELQFIEKTRNVTLEYANTLGFKEVEPKVFVERDSNSRVTLYEL
jgi:cell division protein FtsL